MVVFLFILFFLHVLSSLNEAEAWALERQAITLSFTLTKQIKLMNLSQFVPYCIHLLCQPH